MFIWIIAGVLTVLALAGLLGSFICYRMAFSVPKTVPSDFERIPDGEQYNPFREQATQLIRAVTQLPFEDVRITAFDGISLHAKLYLTSPEAQLRIFFHGYRSVAERDFCGGLQMALEDGCNALLVDQRAHGESGGRCLTFGILERYDCLSWINYSVSRFGKKVKIVPVGISMGAATVLMAAGLNLPENVIGIIADCAYSSPAAIIRKVLRDKHYPVWLFYPLIRLGGILYGHFDLHSASVPGELLRCPVPVLLIHGTDDRFVPFEMSDEILGACPSRITRLAVPHAGHGLSYLVDPVSYRGAVSGFLQRLSVTPTEYSRKN